MRLLLLEHAWPLRVVLLVQVLGVVPAGRERGAEQPASGCWAGLQSAGGVRADAGGQVV